MSTIALIMVTFLLLQTHACNARHTFDLFSYSKLQDADKTKQLHHEYIKGFPGVEDTKETSLEDTSFVTLDKSTRADITDVQGLKGNKPRSMLESKSHEETKEATDASEGEPIEDAVVMDYVQPHRKSPIHNKH
ncbi:uncharacterized protein LOC104907823 [Beta vulgaris subsp. vulgaris]|nr:uncharacterized protein LOC104907823 [Beta vulgaris subsp. vulgaris]